MLELTEKRTLNSKTHDLGNGQHRLTASMIPMHYENNGQLIDIDMTIQNGVVNSGLYKVALMTNKIGFDAIDRGSGKKISVSLSKIGNQNITYSAPVIDGNKAIWPSIKPGVDIEFIFNPHQVNIFRVLKDATAEKIAEWSIDEEIGDKTIKMNDIIRGLDNERNETKHTVIIAPPSKDTQRKSYKIQDTFEGVVYKRNRRTRVKTESTEVQYPVRIDPTVSISILNTADDGSAQRSSYAGAPTRNTIKTIGTDAVFHSTSTNSAILYEFKKDTFLRFPGITIPIGSTITSAYIGLFLYGSASNFPTKFYAKKLNNPNAPTTANQVFSAATLASHVQTHTFSPVTVTTATTTQNSDVTSIVQELVNTFDYSNDAMLFFIRAKQLIASVNIRIQDVSNATGNTSQLVIDYTTGSVATSTITGLGSTTGMQSITF